VHTVFGDHFRTAHAFRLACMGFIRRLANNESSEVCGIIKPVPRVKFNRAQAVNVYKLLTIRYLQKAANKSKERTDLQSITTTFCDSAIVAIRTTTAAEHWRQRSCYE